MQAEVCKSVVLYTVEEVKVEKEFIVAIFWDNKENQRCEEELADRHLGVHVKTPENTSCKPS